jgi:hypothetical protein
MCLLWVIDLKDFLSMERLGEGLITLSKDKESSMGGFKQG